MGGYSRFAPQSRLRWLARSDAQPCFRLDAPAFKLNLDDEVAKIAAILTDYQAEEVNPTRCPREAKVRSEGEKRKEKRKGEAKKRCEMNHD